jgi:hypothetical protein
MATMAGVIGHFPNNEILLCKPEAEAALARTGPLFGYLNMHYPKWLKPKIVSFNDGPWESFERSSALTKDGRVRIASTPGHTLWPRGRRGDGESLCPHRGRCRLRRTDTVERQC